MSNYTINWTPYAPEKALGLTDVWHQPTPDEMMKIAAFGDVQQAQRLANRITELKYQEAQNALAEMAGYKRDYIRPGAGGVGGGQAPVPSAIPQPNAMAMPNPFAQAPEPTSASMLPGKGDFDKYTYSPETGVDMRVASGPATMVNQPPPSPSPPPSAASPQQFPVPNGLSQPPISPSPVPRSGPLSPEEHYQYGAAKGAEAREKAVMESVKTKADSLKDFAAAAGGFRNFINSGMAAQVLPKLGIDPSILKNLKELPGGAYAAPIPSLPGHMLVTYEDGDTGKLHNQVVSTLSGPLIEAEYMDTKTKEFMLKEGLPFPQARAKAYEKAKELSSVARFEAPYASQNPEYIKMLQSIKNSLLDGTRTSVDIRQNGFTTGPLAERAVALAIEEDPSYDPAKAVAYEKSLNNIVKYKGMIDTYKDRIEGNIKLLKVYQQRYPREYGTLINKAARLLVQNTTGSGDLEALRQILESTSSEVAKLETMNLGVAGVTEGARKIWGGIHNVDLDTDKLNKVLDTSSALAQTADKALENTERRIRREMGGKRAKDKFKAVDEGTKVQGAPTRQEAIDRLSKIPGAKVNDKNIQIAIDGIAKERGLR